MFWTKIIVEKEPLDLEKVKYEWSIAVNDKNNKPYKDEKYGNKIRGKIYSVHYLVYNILRKMPEERGFEPVGEGFEEAKKELERAFRNPVYHIEYLGNSIWKDGNRLDDLLYPFNGTVTNEHLQDLLK